MLRDDIYNFSRIGTFIERADNTARILDVKYYRAAAGRSPRSAPRSTTVQWESILRSVSAHRSYSWVYDSRRVKPINIADFLILNGRMPRSLAYCYEKIVNNLAYLANALRRAPRRARHGRRNPQCCSETAKSARSSWNRAARVPGGFHRARNNRLGAGNLRRLPLLSILLSGLTKAMN
jgi:uncharacterized alpha-E superfamily protein